MNCDVYWGSHGCDEPLGHDGLHVCRTCCWEFDESHDRTHADAMDGYGFEGCAGNWPYYGSHNMVGKTTHGLGFFRYSEANGWTFEYLPDEWNRVTALRVQLL